MIQRIKKGEVLIRRCLRERGHDYTAVHDFAITSEVLTPSTAFPPHIQKLYAYLRARFYSGMPAREKSSSSAGVMDGLKSVTHDSDLPTFTKLSCAQGQEVVHDGGESCFGMGRGQHPVIQWHLLENDPKTVALEVPVYDPEMNGFIDILRIHPDFTIEVADFKPDIPVRMKIEGEGDENAIKWAKTKKQSEIESQVARYVEWLCNEAEIDRKFVIGTYFDQTGCYRII